MCGIAAVFGYGPASKSVDRDELVRIRDHMASRGPDGTGLWLSDDGRVGLGHRRLAIIDPRPEADQPMADGDGRIRIIFNGEIYNYRALRSELESRGHRFRTASDTEVLLALYERHGEDMFVRLRGMYAFVLWDPRQPRLLLARGPYGIKPLYYADDGHTIRVASQVKALRAGGALGNEPDPAGVVGFLLFGSVPEPFTWHRAVRAVPAGSCVVVDESGVRAPRRFADIAGVYAEADRANVSEHEAAEIARAAFADSVSHHLIADVPVGAFLSAGVDSGAIVGLMRDCSDAPLRTATLQFAEFEGQADDEAPLAAITAAQYGADHLTRRVDEREFQADLPRILDAMDQPSIDGVNTWFVSKACAERGLKVALSGVGGDELLGSYPSFGSLPRWVRAFGWSNRLPTLGRASRVLAEPLLRRQSRVSPKLAGMLELGGRWAGAYLLRRGLFMPWQLPQILPVDLVEAGLERLRWDELLQAAITPDPGQDFSRVAALESALYMRNQLLRDTDWASMAHSLEVRTPWVDTELLRRLARIVGWTARGSGKSWLAHAPRAPLPQAVVERRKTGFGTPIARWAMRAEQLRPRNGFPRAATQPSQRLALAVLEAFGLDAARAMSVHRSAPRIVQFQRKPFAGNFSVERIFSDVREDIARSDLPVTTRINRHHSKGVLRRLADALGAAFEQGDVNHVTGDVHYLAAFLDPRRTVLTVLDCVTLHRLRGLKQSVFRYFWYTLPTRRCRYITVISEFTKKDLLQEVAIPADKVLVIPPNLSDEFTRFPKDFDAARPRVLQVGTNPNKNLERVADALQGIPCTLVVVGPLSAEQQSRLERNGIAYESRVGLGRDALLQEYQRADLVVFASTYEGFGLPIIEANAVGRPVVTSSVCSMPEVAADAACLVDPTDVGSIRAGILRVIGDGAYRESLVANGYRNAQRFRLPEITRQYVALYRRVHKENLTANRRAWQPGAH